MVKEISLSNFKCFGHLELSCAPLTLLCGLNGMGKSSVIQALLALRQSFRAGRLQEGHLLLDGSLINLGTSTDVLFEDADTEVISLGISIGELPDRWQQSFSYVRDVELLDATGPRPEISNSLCLRPPLGGRVAYVEAERIGPRSLYKQSHILAQVGDFGNRGELVWNLVHERQDDRLPADDLRCENLARPRLLDAIDYWLQAVSPGVHLRLEAIRDADAIVAGFTFDRSGDVGTRRYRATNVGFGLSYVLPVLLGMLSRDGTLVLIENPEAHLHPRGQTRLAELAVRAARSGVQLLIETHSDHFIDGVRIAVRQGMISPNDILIHYFERKDIETVVSSPTIDGNGRLSHWPAGFFDQHEENLVKLLV